MFGAKDKRSQKTLTPVERAREASEAHRPIFQVQIPIATHAIKTGLGGAGAIGVDHQEHDVDELLAAIESEGWTLAHIGFVYEPLETNERGKFTDRNGTVGSVGGRTVGVYLFRRA